MAIASSPTARRGVFCVRKFKILNEKIYNTLIISNLHNITIDSFFYRMFIHKLVMQKVINIK